MSDLIILKSLNVTNVLILNDDAWLSVDILRFCRRLDQNALFLLLLSPKELRFYGVRFVDGDL